MGAVHPLPNTYTQSLSLQPDSIDKTDLTLHGVANASRSFAAVNTTLLS